MRAPISACLIVRNEESQLEACLQSIREHVQELVVVDTGSTDKTPEIAKKYADKFEVYTACNDEQGRILNFAQAREYSFGLSSLPWKLWIDGDDEVRNAERLTELISAADKIDDNPCTILLPYEYARDAQTQRVTCLHYRERLIKGYQHFKWVNPVHEVCVAKDGAPWYRQIQTDAIVIVHRREKKPPNEPGRNLRILKYWYEKEGDKDARLLYYLGLEYGNDGQPDKAIEFLKKYVAVSGWEDEKVLAQLKLAEHYRWKFDYKAQLDWALEAVKVKENWCEPYFMAARACYFLAQKHEQDGKGHDQRNWERCVHFSRLGLQMPPTKTMLFVNPLERDIDIHRYLNMALHKLGDHKAALESINEAIKNAPSDEQLLLNKRVYEKWQVKQEVEAALNRLIPLSDGKMVFCSEEKKRSILNYIDDVNPHATLAAHSAGTSPGLLSELAALVAKHSGGSLPVPVVDVQIQPPTKPAEPAALPPPAEPAIAALPEAKIEVGSGPLDIVLYVGPGIGPWNPATAKETGIGGSETAAVEMSKQLVKRGHKVRVYGECSSTHEGIFDGVVFMDHSKYHDLDCDVLITSRRPHAVDEQFKINRKATFCWIHDVHCGGDLTHARSLQIDKFLCLSNWHKGNVLSYYNFIHPDHIIVTRNGIDLARFDQKVERDPHRAVYGSSPDRGMQVAITVWPRVRAIIPDAELHIFYGFETWEKSAVHDEGQRNLIAHLKQMLKDYEHAAVFFHGRVDQDTLAKEYLQSGVWAYPTWFSETSCITAMESHAAGLRMVTSPIAALTETVADRGTMVPGDWLSLDYQNRFVDAVVAAMQKPEDGDREKLQQYAKDHFSWESLAGDWEKMFHEVIAEMKTRIMPPFRNAG